MDILNLGEDRLYLIAKSHMESLDENFSPRHESDHGASDPFVARLIIQTRNLLKDSCFSDEQITQVQGIFLSIHNRLLVCNKTFEHLKTATLTAIEKTPKPKNPRLKGIPFIPNLEQNVEKILYELKSVLREVVSILNPTYGKDFSEASVLYPQKTGTPSNAQSWAISQFGQNEPLCLFIEKEVEWIEELIRKRNAAEHPGGHSGTLNIENIKLINKSDIILPVWHRTGMPATDVFNDLETFIHNCFTYAEEFLALTIKANPSFKQYMDIYLIPEDQIDPNCPVRYNAGPSAKFYTKYMEI